MNRGIIAKIFLFLCVISVTTQNDLEDCKIRVVELNDMLAQMTAAEDGPNVDFLSSCSALVKSLNGVTSRKRNELRRRRAEVNTVYNETETALINQQKQKAIPLKALPQELRDKYTEAFEFLGREIKEIRINIDSELRKRAAMEEKIEFYELLPSLSSESNDTLCSFNDSLGQLLISTMQENFLFLTETSFNDKCKVLVNKMTNIRSFEKRSFQYEERRLELLNKTHTERNQILDILVKDNDEQRRDFDAIKRDKLEGLTHFRNGVIRENKKVKDELVNKASNFAIKMLQNGVRFEEIKIALKDAENDLYNPLKFVLENTYTCKVKYLSNIVRFAHFHSWTGFPIILEKMKTCEQLDEPIVIKIAKLYKDDETDSFIEEAYKKLAKDIRSNGTDNVVAIVKDLNPDNVDLTKIIRLSYDGDTKNFLSVTQFIEKLGTVNQKLEEALYNEMINSGHVDTKEHVMFGVFIKKLMAQANKASDDIRYKNLESIKNRLPEGIRNLCFSKADYFISADDSAFGAPSGYKMRSFTGGQLFQFEKAKDAGKFLLAAVDGSRIYPTHGKLTRHDAFFWKVKPTDNGKYFQVINAANSYSSSSSSRGPACKRRIATGPEESPQRRLKLIASFRPCVPSFDDDVVKFRFRF